MEDFFHKLFRRLRKELPRRLKHLKDSIDGEIVHLDPTLTPNPSLNITSYFNIFKSLCESKYPRMMEIALEGINFILEHGNFTDQIQSYSSREYFHVTVPIESLIKLVSSCSDEHDEEVQYQVIKALANSVNTSSCSVHESLLLLVFRSCFHINIHSKSQSIKTTSRNAITQMMSVVIQRMESTEDLNVGKNKLGVSDIQTITEEEEEENSPSDDQEGEEAVPPHFSSRPIQYKDAFLVFRSFCKLSHRTMDESLPSPLMDIALQSKLLSLDLILYVLQHSGKTFKAADMFIFAVRHYLVVSLLGNCTSHSTQVVGLSLQIFSTLIEHFKDHLKSEIEIFLSTIFLKILESENSSCDHKLRVLIVFHSLCSDSSGLVEIFINYDCDLEAIDLLRRIVDGFSKIAKNTTQSRAVDFISSSSKKIQQDERNLRLMGLQGLATILHSLLRSAGLTDIPDTDPSVWLEGRLSGPKSSKRSDEDSEPVDDPSTDDPRQREEGERDSEELREEKEASDISVSKVFDAFDQKQKIQEEIETGILRFNQSAKKGLAYLAGLGHIRMTPSDVAKFLFQYKDRLDKTEIGDFLGREREYEDGFCFQTLHEYVNSMDFAGMPFDLAIRHFLSGFRLPGEAQKIDRLMEKFAERYYLQNRDKFASADMAFILAFSTIMLQTNLHNPAIRDDKRMTKEQFVKQNKGISADGELPEELLLGIYDRIAAEPISISQDDKLNKKLKKEESFTVFQQTTDRRRKTLFGLEREAMVRTSHALMRQKSRSPSVYLRHNNVSEESYARPIFEIVWPPLVGVLSQILETLDDPDFIRLSLDAFQCAIQLGCRLDVPLARSTFVNALAKFTALDVVKEIQPKNIECIKSLINISLFEGDFLFDSWTQILQCFSQVNRLQQFAHGLQTDDKFFGSPGTETSSNRPTSISSSVGMAVAGIFSGPSRAEVSRLIEESNAALISSSINFTIIDQIFNNSQSLSAESVLQFVQSLCTVSMLEINVDSSMNSLRDASTPRIFCLQKLVEVADFNMHKRSRLSWSSIWSLLASHFTLVGMHSNLHLSMYAIDSLRQLSIKFLKKEELSNFNFQRLFLNPFEQIISKSNSTTISDLILSCIDNIILSCSPNIRSGWRSILSILSLAACDRNPLIASSAFRIFDNLRSDFFDLLVYDYTELLNCTLSFVAGPHTHLSLRALNRLALVAQRLTDGSLLASLQSQNASSDTFKISWEKSHAREYLPSTCPPLTRLWWSVLLGVSGRITDPRIEVRTEALNTLLFLLRMFQGSFSPLVWVSIFHGILFPIIDSARIDRTPQPTSSFPSENPFFPANPKSWISSTASLVFTCWADLFLLVRDSENKSQFDSLLAAPLFSKLEEFVCFGVETLGRPALQVLRRLSLALLSPDQPPYIMDLVCQTLTRCLRSCLCLDFSTFGSLPLTPTIDAHIEGLSWPTSCPVKARSQTRSLTLHNFIGREVRTSFGTGTIVEVQESFPMKFCVQLRGIGKLYCLVDSPCMLDGPLKGAASLEWAQYFPSVSTGMALSLQLLRLIKEVCDLHAPLWTLPHYRELFSSLFLTYCHSRSFNENHTLRRSLHSTRFMLFPDDQSRLPHLLEQEVESMSLLLDVSLRLLELEDSSPDLSQFSEPWFHKFCKLASGRYLTLEKSLALSSDPSDHDQLEAYGTNAVAALKGLSSLRPLHFERCLDWLLAALSRLVLVEDMDIRGFVSEIYISQINPLLLLRSTEAIEMQN